MGKRNKILYGTLITLSFLAIGTSGYMLIEDFTFIDALYMTVITISTVGFGEIRTLSEPGRIFTIFLIFFGFGSIGFLAHAFMEAIVAQATSTNPGRKAMNKRIAQLRDHVIICGFGRVGEAAAEHFHAAGVDFVVLENSGEQIKRISEYKYCYLDGDATREETLLSAGIKKAAALVALLNSDPENLFTVLTARELNPTLRIIARAELATSESRMLRAGADSILSPYVAAGRSVAEKIVTGTSQKSAASPEVDSEDSRPAWVKVSEQSDLAGHVMETAATFLNGRIVGLRRGTTDTLLPSAEERIALGDELLVIAQRPLTEATPPVSQRLPGKIILIDANPVILRLYTRLFQKTGFHVLTATDGRGGFSQILAEQPDAAIIDIELADMSGIDLCRRLRTIASLHDMKIFLFTANAEQETRQIAMEAGVDTVIIKSPDASELVHTVKQHLRSQPTQ